MFILADIIRRMGPGTTEEQGRMMIKLLVVLGHDPADTGDIPDRLWDLLEDTAIKGAKEHG